MWATTEGREATTEVQLPFLVTTHQACQRGWKTQGSFTYSKQTMAEKAEEKSRASIESGLHESVGHDDTHQDLRRKTQDLLCREEDRKQSPGKREVGWGTDQK